MKKKIISFLILLTAVLFPSVISAQELTSDTTLSADVKDGIVVKSGNNVTLDLAGYSITNANGKDTIVVEKGATLNIKGEGVVTNTSHAKAVILNDGLLAIKGGTYRRVDSKTNSFYVVLNHGNMTINNGLFEMENGYSSLIDNGWYSPEKNTSKEMSYLTIKGGTFNMSGNDKYIKNDDYGMLTINAGEFNMKDPASACIANVGFYSGKELLTINGGTYNYTGSNVAIFDYDWNNNGYTDNSKTVVNGGNFKLANENAKVTNVVYDEQTTKKDYKVIGKDNEYVVAGDDEITEVTDVKEVKKEDVKEEDTKLIENTVSNKYNVVGYYDINTYKALKDDNSVLLDKVSETDKKVKVTLQIPANLKKVLEGYTRTYYVIRVHNGVADILDATLNDDGTVSFETDKFSTYTLTYKDVKNSNNSAVNNTNVVANPKTADSNILLISVIGLVSALGILISGLYLKLNY